MKTQALTPSVQNFCSAMDAKLNIRLEDLQHYLPSHDTGKYTHTLQSLDIFQSRHKRTTWHHISQKIYTMQKTAKIEWKHASFTVTTF